MQTSNDYTTIIHNNTVNVDSTFCYTVYARSYTLMLLMWFIWICMCIFTLPLFAMFDSDISLIHSTLLCSIWDWKDARNEVNFSDARALASESWTLDNVSFFRPI